MRLCHVDGVKYVVDQKHGVEVMQMGRYHLLITVKGESVKVILQAGNSAPIVADEITQATDMTAGLRRFLLSTDVIPWVENDKMKAQLLIFGDGINLVFDIKP